MRMKLLSLTKVVTKSSYTNIAEKNTPREKKSVAGAAGLDTVFGCAGGALGLLRVMDEGIKDVTGADPSTTEFDESASEVVTLSKSIITPGSSFLELAPLPSIRVGLGGTTPVFFGAGSIDNNDEAPAPFERTEGSSILCFFKGSESSSSEAGLGGSTFIFTGPSLRRELDFGGGN